MASATTSAQPSALTALSRWTPSLPTGLIDMLNPFGGDDTNKQTSDTPSATGAASTPTKKRPFLANLLFDSSSTSAPADLPSPSKSDASIMFAEPDTRSTSDADSREGSFDDTKRCKRSNRPKTCYSVCHPPPTSSKRQKLHRRPRSLLQLHKLSPNARPQPALEVIPSASFSVRLTRAITKVFKTKHGLCPNDLVVLKAEKYSHGEEDEEQEARAVIGLICKGRREESGAVGKAKICLANGKEWEAYPLANGGYEFSSTDEHGLALTVRWVTKKNKDATKPSSKRFNFSTISPNTRRHPVIACLSKSGLDVNDTYRLPEPTAVTPISTPRQTSVLLADAMDDELSGEALLEQRETDAVLRELIAMTGIWVTFKEGWSPTFKYDDKEVSTLQRSSSVQSSPSKPTIASPVPTPPGSPQQIPLDKRNSIKSNSSGTFRRFSALNKASISQPPTTRANRASTITSPSIEEGTQESETINRTNSLQKGNRSRADSSATVLVHRAASNRRKNNQQATWRPDLLAAQQELNEAAREASYSASAPDLTVAERPLATSVRPGEGALQRGTDVAAISTTPAPSRLPSSQSRPSSAPGEKRDSTTTTDTAFSGPAKATVSAAASKGRAGKKSRGWRRIFCGSSHDI